MLKEIGHDRPAGNTHTTAAAQSSISMSGTRQGQRPDKRSVSGQRRNDGWGVSLIGVWRGFLIAMWR